MGNEPSDPEEGPRRYRLEASREGIDVEFAEAFWDTDGLDFGQRVERLAVDIRTVAYTLALGTRH